MSVFLCAPAVLLYGGFVVLPALVGFAYSLTRWTGWSVRAPYVGLANFIELFGDRRFLHAIRFTLFETALIVLFFTFGSLLLAVLLDRARRMPAVLRGVFFYPYVLSVLVTALLFRYMANYREGAINTLLRSAGLERLAQDWMGNPALVPYFILALVVWSGLGFFTTIYLANLQTIPGEIYEAGAIDGAGPLTVFRRIQLPMLIPAMTANSVVAMINGLNMFSQIMVTTEGGPGYRTMTVGYYIYWQGILNNRQGYSAAVSFVVFAAVVAIAVVQLALLRKRDVEL